MQKQQDVFQCPQNRNFACASFFLTDQKSIAYINDTTLTRIEKGGTGVEDF
jgi:hypothetical protein